VQPSSLVFLVIIAVWAAYFLQYWVRRREHLATARSVDQFSESMRVLERRNPLPAANLSSPQPRSYAVSPARAARPQVLVKRAETSEAAPDSADLHPAVAPDSRESRDSRAVQVAARRTRGMVMLGAASTVLVAVPLVALSLLPLMTLLVPVVCVGGAVAWARATAMAERRVGKERAPSRGQARPSAQHASRRVAPTRVAPTHVAPARTTAPAVASTDDFVSDSAQSTPSEEVVSDVAATQSGELYDVQAVEAAERPVAAQAAVRSTPARHLVDEDDIPLTWDPVPVPRPTYTMKSRATRPAPTAADLVGDADTEYAAYDRASVRRVAGA
jgi:cytoskeletal protein RodZ